MKLLDQIIAHTAKQVGVIVSGNGMCYRQWIDNAKAEGYAVRLCGRYVELYR